MGYKEVLAFVGALATGTLIAQCLFGEEQEYSSPSHYDNYGEERFEREHPKKRKTNYNPLRPVKTIAVVEDICRKHPREEVLKPRIDYLKIRMMGGNRDKQRNNKGPRKMKYHEEY